MRAQGRCRDPNEAKAVVDRVAWWEICARAKALRLAPARGGSRSPSAMQSHAPLLRGSKIVVFTELYGRQAAKEFDGVDGVSIAVPRDSRLMPGPPLTRRAARVEALTTVLQGWGMGWKTWWQSVPAPSIATCSWQRVPPLPWRGQVMTLWQLPVSGFRTRGRRPCAGD